MHNTGSESKVTHEFLLNFFKKNFTITNNFPRDTEKENQIIMKEKASLLIYSALRTRRFFSFMRNGKSENRGNSECTQLIFDLKNPIIYKENNENESFELIFDKLIIDPNSDYKYCNESDYKSRIWRVKIDDADLSKRYEELRVASVPFPPGNGKSYIATDKETDGKDKLKEQSEKANNHYNSLFDCCKEVSPYNTPEKVCKFFNNQETAYSPLLKLASNLLRNELFMNQSDSKEPNEVTDLKASTSDDIEADIVEQVLLDFINKNTRSINLNSYFEKYYDEILKLVYSFKNEDGEVVQKILKIFDGETQKKVLIPCTLWMKPYSKEEFFCIPLPEQQILYNLDLIKSQNSSTIILSDSIEIADANQQKNSLGLVWTSFICDSKEYDQVDFKPLKGRDVYYLITNHSGESLAEAYIKACEIAEHLKEKTGVELNFIRIAVDFHDQQRSIFCNLDEIILHRRRRNPTVRKDSIKIMGYSELEDMHKKAVESIEAPKKEFWEEEAITETLSTSDASKKSASRKQEAIDYIMRPIIEKGKLTMLYASTGLGKSNLLWSLCTSIIAGKTIFEERWWTVPKSEYGFRKVLYLDFENGESSFKNSSFIKSCLPQNSSKKKQIMSNFIFKDLENHTTDYSAKENHEQVLEFLAEAEQQGVKGQPVDLIVFDTYKQLVVRESASSWEKVKSLFNRIKSKGIAIVLVHHAKNDGKSDSGYLDKSQESVTVIKLNRIGKKGETLKSPMAVEFDKNRKNCVPLDGESFNISFIDNKWECSAPKLSKDEAFCEINKAYKQKGYAVKSIYTMLGISDSTYHEKQNKCGKGAKKTTSNKKITNKKKSKNKKMDTGKKKSTSI